MLSSTPGGMEIGMRPSLDGLPVVAENWRAGVVWKAGTRNDGSDTTEGDSIALLRARPLLGANIVVVLLL